MHFLLLLLSLLLPFFLCAQESSYNFGEVWAYLFKGEEKHLNGINALSDIAYFSAEINETGRIDKEMEITKIPSILRKGKRVHLVISTPPNRSLMYFCLTKDLSTRQGLLEDIVRLSSSFDGVQIDFESLRKEEKSSYLSFLIELKKKLAPGKVFSVAVPARVKEMDDPFPYQEIGAIADRVIVMAYDEHWRTGPAGAIASTKWSEKVLAFAQQKIPQQKLIMGIPLYGRVWQEQTVARALKYPETLALWKQQSCPLQRDPDGTPHFSYQQTVHAHVYFEDTKSLESKLACYQNTSIRGIAFWRISQGPAALWTMVQSN